MQSPPFLQGTTIRDVLDPTAIWDEPLFSHHVFKFIRIKLSKAPLLGDVDLGKNKELNQDTWGLGQVKAGTRPQHYLPSGGQGT